MWTGTGFLIMDIYGNYKMLSNDDPQPRTIPGEKALELLGKGYKSIEDAFAKKGYLRDLNSKDSEENRGTQKELLEETEKNPTPPSKH